MSWVDHQQAMSRAVAMGSVRRDFVAGNQLRLYIDVTLDMGQQPWRAVTFGPFSTRMTAEQALLEVMRRADVRGAIIREAVA